MSQSVNMVSPAGNMDGCPQTLESFGRKEAEKARRFHSGFEDYAVTPLAHLSNLAEHLGIKDFYVKDESYRFGLNAFKGLGGSYCLGRYIAEAAQIDISDLSYPMMISDEIREKTGDITFVTATDGNHGRGIAWAAQRLRQKAVVYMPKGSVQERLQNIRNLGAEASITDWNYDDTVRFAAQCEQERGWVLVQDTAWPGYEKIPTWIMQGYLTMALEAVEQLQDVKPTHIFLQAGVGAMSGALTGFFADYYGDVKPVITIVEPDHADCIYQTAAADDGKLHAVKGDLHTIMAGLACGEPCTIGWKSLRAYAEHFVSMPDYVAANGMRILGNPMGTDPRVISGESGAAGAGFAAEVLTNARLTGLRDQIGLNQDSVVLCFSTEGDTDRENYRNIVWNGAFSRD